MRLCVFACQIDGVLIKMKVKRNVKVYGRDNEKVSGYMRDDITIFLEKNWLVHLSGEVINVIIKERWDQFFFSKIGKCKNL